jgi:hypothetical protein
MISFQHQRYWRASKHWGRSYVVLLVGLLTGGCGGSHGEVSGKVYYKGQPLTAPGAIVTFIDANGEAFSSSITSDGSYTLTKVPVGQVRIGVVVLPPKRTNRVQQKEREVVKAGLLKIPPEEVTKMVQDFPLRGLAIPIPVWYADPEKSGLMHTVTGGKQSYDIELR